MEGQSLEGQVSELQQRAHLVRLLEAEDELGELGKAGEVAQARGAEARAARHSQAM